MQFTTTSGTMCILLTCNVGLIGIMVDTYSMKLNGVTDTLSNDYTKYAILVDKESTCTCRDCSSRYRTEETDDTPPGYIVKFRMYNPDSLSIVGRALFFNPVSNVTMYTNAS